MKLTIEDAENGWVLKFKCEGLYGEEDIKDTSYITVVVQRDDNKCDAENSVSLLEEVSDILSLSTGSKREPKVLAIVTVPGQSCDDVDLCKYEDYDWRIRSFAERFLNNTKEGCDK